MTIKTKTIQTGATVRTFDLYTSGKRTVGVRVDGIMIPVDLIILVGGRHAWMKKIDAPCRECGKEVPIGTMEQGGFCGKCHDAFDPDADVA